MYFTNLAQCDAHKAAFEKRHAEAADRVKEAEVHLKRRERDIVEFDGKLKYSASNMAPEDAKALQIRLDSARSDAAKLEVEHKERSRALADVDFTVESLKRVWEEQIAAMRKELGPAVAPGAELGDESATIAAEENSGSGKAALRSVRIVSFRDAVEKIVAELTGLAELRLTLYEGVGDDVPHYTSWEQRTAAAIFQAKGKVNDALMSLVAIVNGTTATFPALAADVEKLGSFVTWIDAAFQRAVTDAVRRAMWTWERQITGRSAREIFSVNMKLGSACRLVFVPPVADMPKLIGDVLEKAFGVCPESTVADLVSARTNLQSGRGKCLAVLQADADVQTRWQAIKVATGTFAEDIIAFATHVEERFEYLWQPDMTAMSATELRNGMDELSFNFINRLVVRNAVVVNAFPLQDAVLSMCAAHYAKLREAEFQAALTDDALKARAKDTTVADATRPLPVPTYGGEKGRVDVKAILAKGLRGTSAAPSGGAKQLAAQATAPPATATADTAAAVGAKENSASSATVAATPTPAANCASLGAPTSAAPAAAQFTTQNSPRPSTTPINSRSALQPLERQQQAAQSMTPQKYATASQQRERSIDGAGAGGSGAGATSPNAIPPPPPPAAHSVEAMRGSAAASSGGAREHTSAKRVWDSPAKPSAADDESPSRQGQRPPGEAPHSSSGGSSPYARRISGGGGGGGGNSPSHPASSSGASASATSGSGGGASGGGSQYGQRAKPRRITERGDGDSDEAIIQRLLQREKESLERLRRQKESDDERRRREAAAEEERERERAMAEAQRLAAQQHAQREERERERQRAAVEAQRSAKEDQQRLERELEKRLDDEMRRRAEQQRRERAEREEREAAAAATAAAAKAAELRRLEEAEAARLAEVQRKKAPSPPSTTPLAPPPNSATAPAATAGHLQQQPAFVRRNNSIEPQLGLGSAASSTSAAAADSALRRKLALPPVVPRRASNGSGADELPSPSSPPNTRSNAHQHGGGGGGDANIDASSVLAERKPSTAPAGSTTPRGGLGVARTAVHPTGASATLNSQQQPQPLRPPVTLAPMQPQQQPASPPPSAPTGAAEDESSALTRSLLDEYKAYCSEYGIKPNSGLLKTLPRGVGENVTTINLDLNYIGVKGVQPLIHVLKLNRGLQLLNLKDNNLENNEVRALVSVLLTESGACLQHLDLSNNPISLAGGSALMDLVTRQKALTKVVLRGTLIQPKVVDGIVQAAEANGRGQ